MVRAGFDGSLARLAPKVGVCGEECRVQAWPKKKRVRLAREAAKKGVLRQGEGLFEGARGKG